MLIVYDATSDTLQTRTRRYQRDRELARVIIPSWPMLNPDAEEFPDWMHYATLAHDDTGACPLHGDADNDTVTQAYEALGLDL